MIGIKLFLLVVAICLSIVLSFNINNNVNKLNLYCKNNNKLIISSIVAIGISISIPGLTLPSYSVDKNDLGANDSSNTKIKKGGASTLQKGVS